MRCISNFSLVRILMGEARPPPDDIYLQIIHLINYKMNLVTVHHHSDSVCRFTNTKLQFCVITIDVNARTDLMVLTINIKEQNLGNFYENELYNLVLTVEYKCRYVLSSVDKLDVVSPEIHLNSQK